MNRWIPAFAAVGVLAMAVPTLAAPTGAERTSNLAASATSFALAEAEPGADQPERALIDTAKAEMAAGSFEQAITHLNDALEKAPGDPELTALLGDAKTRSADNYVKTGKQLLQQRKYRDAGVAFDNALDLVPNHPLATKGKEAATKWPTAESYCETARNYLDKRDWDEAIAYYQKAYELTKDPSIAKWLAAAKLAKSKQRQ